MGIICSSTPVPQKNARVQRARSRLESMAVGNVEPSRQRRHHAPSSAMSIGHLTKINTLVMVGPGTNEANFMANAGDVSGTSAALMRSAMSSGWWTANSNSSSGGNRTMAKFTLELSMRQNHLIEKCWRDYIAHRHPDIFHRTMLNVIEASPKVNEVIACQRYCFRDLTKWPKLNRICQAQFSFFERLIFTLNLNEQKLLVECTRLGQTHAQYAQYGLKPHFLDIFQHQFLGLLEKILAENEKEKQEMIGAFNILISFILDVLNHAYSLKMSELRLQERTTSNLGRGEGN